MRVIDSYNGCGFYAVGADSAKSAASAEKAAKYIDGADLASKDYVAYNYVKLSAYNKDMAISSMSSTVETCMQYSTWLPAFYYPKTDTSSKDEISAAFANIPGGGDMLKSKLEFNASDEITGYDGSAFAHGGGGGTVTGDYLEMSASAALIGVDNATINNYLGQSPKGYLAFGYNNKVGNYSFAVGSSNSANSLSVAVGTANSATGNGIAVGGGNYVTGGGIGVGSTNSAVNYSIAVGSYNRADEKSFSIGMQVTATNTAFAFGNNISANKQSLAFGNSPSANSGSISFGDYTTANSGSFAMGDYTSATNYSFAFGDGVTANQKCSANNHSVAIGKSCSANDFSVAFGQQLKITDYGLAIGVGNKTSADVAFVIGNGALTNGGYCSDANRSDLFVIDKNGNVSSKSGFFYDKDGRVGNYHKTSATVTNNGTNFTITLSSNNSYVVLDNSAVSGNQPLNITIVPPTLEQDELLDCIVQFKPKGGAATSGHNVSASGLTQVGVRAFNFNGVDLNYIRPGETAQVRLLGDTYCFM